LITRAIAALGGLAATLRGAVVVGAFGSTRVANLPGFVGAVGRTSEVVARLGIAAIGIAAIGGGITGPLLDTVILAAAASSSTAAAATAPTAATVAVHFASAFTFTGFARVGAEFARGLSKGGGSLVIAATRRPVVIAGPRRPVVIAGPWWPVVIAAARWPVVVAAAGRPFRPNAPVVVGATVSFVAAFAVGRLFHISGDVSGGGLRGRPWSRPWRGAGFGGSADTEFGGKFVPVAGLRRRRLRSLRRLRPLRRGLLRAGRRRLGRLVGGHRAERFGERSPGIVRIVI
jgi:hypothetical protein